MSSLLPIHNLRRNNCFQISHFAYRETLTTSPLSFRGKSFKGVLFALIL